MKSPAAIVFALTGVCFAASLTSCTFAGDSSPASTLKDVYKNDFLVGVAINQKQFTGEDTNGAAIIAAQFNSISPENVLKWESIQPRPGKDGYNFEPGDRYVEFGERNGMYVIGHTLVWHSQTPKWVFLADDGTNYCDRETLLKRMQDHIQTVVGRYKGRSNAGTSSTKRCRKTAVCANLPGKESSAMIISKRPFNTRMRPDPDAVLRYNDYSLENEPKRKGALALIKKLQAEGIPVSAVGLQDHVKLDWPSVEQEDATISDFAKLGVKVMITELDVDLLSRSRSADVAEMQKQVMSNNYTNGLPDSVQQALAKRYANLFSVFLKHRKDVALVTFWGVSDGDSWLNRGRMNYPLLFGRDHQPKPAFDAVIQAGSSKNVAQ